MKKVLSAIGNVLIILFLIFAIVLTVISVTAALDKNKVPNLMGYAMMSVQTDSMEAEGGFYTGDVIFVRLIDDEEANNLHVGDVITFRRTFKNNAYLDTHRIVENTYETIYAREVVDGIRIHDGTKCYVTKGDNEEAIDFLENGSIAYATAGNIVGVWTGKSIPKLGMVLDFLRSQVGFFVCIIIPLLAFFLYQLIHLITTLGAKKKAEALEAVADSEEAIKQKAIQEYLAQQAAAQAAAAEDPKPEEPKPEEPKPEEPKAEEPKAEE